MSKLFDNFIFLVDLSQKTQKEILQSINISTNSPYQWKVRGSANDTNLKKLAKYFSSECDIPYEIFKEGHALITDDLESIIKNLSNVRKNETSATDLQYKQESISPDECEPLSQDEIEFLLQLRKGARTKYPLSRATLDRIQETVALLGGPDSSQHLQAIEFLRFFSRGWENAPQRARESKESGSSNHKQ